MEQLSETDINRIAERIDAGGARIIRQGNGESGFRKLIDGLLILAVASIVGVVWKLSNNVSAQQVQVMFLLQEVQALRARTP